MHIFLSHNSADKVVVRTLAMLLAGEGITPFFDEWDIRIGDPLMRTIERGIEDADVFLIFWSASALQSNWVDAELQTFLRRRIDNPVLRPVPIMLDDTPLPALLANYAGMNISEGNPQGDTIETVVRSLVGDDRDVQLAQRLQRRLNQLALKNLGDSDHFGWLVCPGCGSNRLRRYTHVDPARDDIYYMIDCEDCGCGDWTQ